LKENIEEVRNSKADDWERLTLALIPQIRSNSNRKKISAYHCKVRVEAPTEMQACSYDEYEMNVRIKQDCGYGCVTSLVEIVF
jgi:hypothetical protein